MLDRIKDILKSNKFKLLFNIILFILILVYIFSVGINFYNNAKNRNSNGALADSNREQYHKVLKESSDLREDKTIQLYRYDLIKIDEDENKIEFKDNYNTINKKLIVSILDDNVKDEIEFENNKYLIDKLDVNNLGNDTKLLLGILNDFKDINKKDIDLNSCYIKIKYYKQLAETSEILKDTYKKHDLDSTLYSLKATFNFVIMALFIYIEKYIIKYIIILRKEVI